MIEQLQKILSGGSENSLSINCGTAFILSDREGFLEKFDSISINCGDFLASAKAYAGLMARGATVNSGSNKIREISGEIVQLDGGTVITEDMDFTDKFVVSGGDAVVGGNGGKALLNAEGAHFAGTIFYPRERGSAFLANVTGDKQPYPQDAHLVFGDKKLGELLSGIPDGKTHIWVHGEITAMEEEAFQKAVEKGLRFTCTSLFTMEAYNEKFGAMIESSGRVVVPEGYEVTPGIQLTAGEAALFGPRIYVRGNMKLSKKDENCLDELEGIIVKGTATIPSSCAKAFRAIGKADKYELIADDVGEVMVVNGFQSIGHDYLQALIEKGETIRINVNGFLLFDEGVTAGDMDAIESIKINGFAIMPDAAQGALSSKIGKINGFTLSIEVITKLTGMTLPEILVKLRIDEGTSINTGFYLLV